MAEDKEINCDLKGGGIKAVLIQPMSLFPKNYSDEEHISKAEPFLQIGDFMAEEGETIKFGSDTIYIKFKQDEQP